MRVADVGRVVEVQLDVRGKYLMLVEVGRSMSRFLKYIGLTGGGGRCGCLPVQRVVRGLDAAMLGPSVQRVVRALDAALLERIVVEVSVDSLVA